MKIHFCELKSNLKSFYSWNNPMTHGHTINTVSSYSQGIHWNDNVRKIIFSLCVYTYLFIYYMFVFQPHPGAEQPRVLLCFGMEMLPIEFTLLKITVLQTQEEYSACHMPGTWLFTPQQHLCYYWIFLAKVWCTLHQTTLCFYLWFWPLLGPGPEIYLYLTLQLSIIEMQSCSLCKESEHNVKHSTLFLLSNAHLNCH